MAKHRDSRHARQERAAEVLCEHVRGWVPSNISLYDLAGLVLDAADKPGAK